jgi:Ser/Thr protein kinase RdoA (MazF antagonist)
MPTFGNTGIYIDALHSALKLWLGWEQGQLTLINHTENATFLVALPSGAKRILRVHRHGYNSKAAILSELAWSRALRNDTGIKTPVSISGINGELLQQAIVDASGHERFLVLFEFEEGIEPKDGNEIASHFVSLGGLAATAHNHAQNWILPPSFARLNWNANSILDQDGLWGDWRKAPGMSEQYYSTFVRLDARLRERLKKFGSRSDRYGLIHADMRLANLLIDGDNIKLIDFDDCGFCWYIYDFAAAISFIEDSPAIPEMKAAWLKGYRQVRSLTQDEEAEIDTFVMLRRMALTAWIGSHAETPFAQSLAQDFVPRGAKLAEDYLAKYE